MNQRKKLRSISAGFLRLGILAAWPVCPAGPLALAQDAWWSSEGDLQNATDVVQLSFELIDPVSSADACWLQTFSQAGGTNAVGDPISAGGFDPILTLYEVTGGGEVNRGVNDDSDNTSGIRDAWLSWSGVAPDPFPVNGYINTDPLAVGDYRADLTAYVTSYPGGRSPWALDLYGPWFPVTLTGLATTGDASIRSLKFGGDLGGGAYFSLAPSTSATVTHELVVGAGGEGQLALPADSTLHTPGTTSVGHNGQGFATVYGLNAQWQAGSITVGGQLGGSGSVTVTDQGDISSGDVQIATPWADGTVLVDGTASTGGLIVPARWDASGSITIGSTGSGAAAVTIQNNGVMTATHDVSVSGTSAAAASVTLLEAGALRVDGTITVGPYGTVSLLQGTQSEAEIETHSFLVDPDGTFDHQDGILIVDGGTFDPGSQNPGMSSDVIINGADAADFPTIRFINGASVLLPFGNGQIAVVGSSNRGRLEILSGSDFNITSGFLSVGTRWVGSVNPVAYGEVLVDGDGSRLTTLTGLRLGGGLAGGHGTLRISNGGELTSSADIIAASAGSTGNLEVSGTNSLGTVPSRYTMSGPLEVGYFGQGTLLIADGGKVSNTGASIASYLGSDNSTATVDGSGPAGPSTWEISGSLYIGGDDGALGAGGTGTLTVSNGGVVDVTDTLKAWSPGQVKLLGGEIRAGSFINTGGGTFRHDDGTLTVDGGTFAPNAGGNYSIDGPDALKLPAVKLTGGADYTSTGTLFVGHTYSGLLEIRSGSTVNTLNGRVGWFAGDSRGDVIVDGNQSQWVNTSDLEIGVRNYGAMLISNGGRVENTDGAIGVVAGSAGNVVVESGGVWENSAALYVGGKLTAGGVGNLFVLDGGLVNVGTAGLGLVRLYPSGGVQINTGGKLEADRVELVAGASSNMGTGPGSTLQVNSLIGFGPNPVFGGNLTLGSANGPHAGDYTVAGGESLSAESILVGGDPLRSATLTVESGGVVVTSGMALSQTGILTGGGEVVTPALESSGLVVPGSSAGRLTIDGDYEQLAVGILEIEIGGEIPGVEFDTLFITGEALLDGILEVSLIDPLGGSNVFVPRAGDRVEILTALGGLDGTRFDTLPGDLPTLTGDLAWDIVYGSDFVRLDVLTPFSADFDRDGDVDADDLRQWQGDHGLNGDADADSDGDSDGADFLAWQRQYGSGLPLAASTAVPEPSTTMLLAGLAALGACARRGRCVV